jgi:capsid protein
MVSPKDEIPAMRDASRNGITTRSENIRSLGFDPERVEQEFADENARADALGLRFDSDGRIRSPPAAPRRAPPADAAATEGNTAQPGNNSETTPAPTKEKPTKGKQK